MRLARPKIPSKSIAAVLDLRWMRLRSGATSPRTVCANPASPRWRNFVKRSRRRKNPSPRKRPKSLEHTQNEFLPVHVPLVLPWGANSVVRTAAPSAFRVYSPRPMPTFYDRFVECAQRWPENVALELQRHDHLESCTYAELRRMAESVGRWITDKQFPHGSRLALLADNHPRWVAAYLGIIASGCAAVPLDTALHDDQVTKLLKDSGTTTVLCDAKHLSVVRPAASELKLGLILMDPDRITGQPPEERWLGTLPAIFDAGPGNFKTVASKDDDLASLLYTSGTTADPKGVMLTHANLIGEVEAVFNWIDLGPSDALLGVLPLFHVLAQMANLLIPLVKGSRVVYLETLNTTQLLRALTERNITAFAVVPQFFYLIYERLTQEIAKRGAIAQKVFAGMVAVNRTLRRVGINAGPILFRKVHDTLGPKMRYLVTGGSRFDQI